MVKTYIPENSDIIEGTDQLNDHPHTIAFEQLVPAIVQRSRDAVLVDKTPVYYYQRKRFGSICTCYDQTNKQALISCPVCYGTGKVGGYNKYGTSSVIIYPEYPDLMLINVKLDDTSSDGNSPTKFVLDEDKEKGIIEGKITLPPGIKAIDYLRLYYSGSKVTVNISKESPINWVSLNKIDLLTLAETETSILFRIILEQPEFSYLDVIHGVDNPEITHLLIRFQIGDMELYTDKPRITESISLEEFGLDDVYESALYFFTADLKNASTEDMFYDTLNKKRFKCVEINPNRPLQILTSWDITARVIQSFEAIYKFPI